MKGYRISLIRHGRTEANDKGIYIGRTDYPLSQKGISELYNKLDEFEYPHVGKVYSSPLQRCTETAEILFPDSSVQIVENLIEMDFGDFEGKSADELVKKPGGSVVHGAPSYARTLYACGRLAYLHVPA